MYFIYSNVLQAFPLLFKITFCYHKATSCSFRKTKWQLEAAPAKVLLKLPQLTEWQKLTRKLEKALPATLSAQHPDETAAGTEAGVGI